MHSVIILFLLVAVMTDAVQVTKVCKGESKILMCPSVTDYTNSYVRFENKKVKEKPGKFKYLKNGTLLVENINEADQGLYEYRCEYRTTCSMKLKSCKVNVEVNCESLSVPMGSRIKMTCKTTRPKDTIIKEIKWYKQADPKRLYLANNNRTTDQSKKVFSGRLKVAGDTLEITDARKADEGMYYCIATFKIKGDDINKRSSSYLYHIHVVFKEASKSYNATISTTTQPAPPTTMTTGTTRANSVKTDVESSNGSKPTNIPTTQPHLYEKTSSKVSLSDETAPTTMAANNNTRNNTSDKPVIRARISCTTRVSGTDSKLYMYMLSLIGLVWLMTSSINGI